MKTPFCRHIFLFLAVLGLTAASAPGGAQTIPVEHFPGLRFDGPVPARLATGEALPLSAEVLDPTWEEVLFSFRPLDGGDEVNVWVEHLPGRIERTFTFAHAQADSYRVVLFAGSGGGQLTSQGVFEPFVVTQGGGPVSLPARFFDGVVLDAPLSTSLRPGAALPFAGSVADDRITSLRLDVSRAGASLGSVSIPLQAGRFELPVRLPEAAAGPLRLELVVGLDDGSYWGRGAFDFELLPAGGPVAAPAVLSAALLPGGVGEIRVDNRGDAALHILAATVDPPFEVVSTPGPIAPGAGGDVGVRYGGTGGDQTDLVLDTDDPLRPQRRIRLVGLADGGQEARLAWVRADADGILDVPAPADGQRFAVALFSPRHDPGRDRLYPLSIGTAAPASRPVAAAGAAQGAAVQTDADRRRAGEALRDARAAELAAAVRRRGGLPAARRTQASYRIGDERTFVFDDYPPVPRQVLPARVVAVSERAVAFVHVGTRADGGDLTAAQIQAHLDGFDADYDAIVATFGAPSDVDGDGRIAFLYTPRVDDIGLGGFQDPASVLPESVGGTGNLTDLLFLSPTQPAASYRSLLVHEFQHLISFHQHVLVRGGHAEATWLNEGLSHLTEDLVGGFVAGGNAENVQTYLADPSAAGLTATGYVTGAERGAAYLFVRGLVDRFGPGILLRLVQTGRTDRDNVEAATGVAFRDLLAGYAVRLYASGTGIPGLAGFDFGFPGLDADGVRGFPQPATLDAQGLGAVPALRPRGVAFVEAGAPLRIATDPGAELAGVVLPLPAAWPPRVDIPADYFAGLRFDPPLPGALAAGAPLRIAGQADPGLQHLTLRLRGAGTGDAGIAFFVSIGADGRFDRTVVLADAWRGPQLLDVFTMGGPGSGYAGSFDPVRVGAAAGPVWLPVGYFHNLRLDAPLPARWDPGTPVQLAGQVLDAGITALALELLGPDGQERRVDVSVADGRFAAELPVADWPEGEVQLRVFAGSQSLALRGQFPFTIGTVPTAVTGPQATRPQAFALRSPYPNPFNASTVVPLELSVAGRVEVDVFDLAGQRVARLLHGQLGPGQHRLRWDGRTAAGHAAASGVYWIRAVGAQGQVARKVLLLR